jgi:LPXTG-site transpeptidase (sortase) family protein
MFQLRRGIIFSALASLAISAVVIYFYFCTNRMTPNIHTYFRPTQTVQNKENNNKLPTTQSPVHLTISSVGIQVDVIKGYFNPKTGQWTLTTDKAQYIADSSPPNMNSGNTYIYGHYRKQVFANLHKLLPGSIAEVQSTDGYIYKYKLRDTYSVSPEDTSVINQNNGPRLTLQTCTGILFQQRQIYNFEFIDRKKA